MHNDFTLTCHSVTDEANARSHSVKGQKHQPETWSILYIYTVSHQLQSTSLYTTGTQIIQVLNVFYCFFLFIFLHLTCMLKKSQSWGLSSSPQDKTELHSPPTSLPSRRIIRWSVFVQRIGPESPSISLRNAPKPEMFCLPDHSLRRKLCVHFFINVNRWTLCSSSWTSDHLCFMNKREAFLFKYG